MCWLILFSDCLPSNTGGSLRPLYPMTLLLIFLRSSLDKSPFHILFSICSYCGSSLKRCLLFSMITTFMLFSQTPLDKVENKSSFSLLQTGSSWRKFPENMMENPPKIRAPLGARAYPWILSKYFPCVHACVRACIRPPTDKRRVCILCVCGILVVFCSYLEYNAITPFCSHVLYRFLHTYFFSCTEVLSM